MSDLPDHDRRAYLAMSTYHRLRNDPNEHADQLWPDVLRAACEGLTFTTDPKAPLVWTGFLATAPTGESGDE